MIQIEVDGFSGPLDLLCHMIESREMEASRISVAEIVRVYGAYHAKKGEVPIDVVASFLVQAAKLVLDKAIALMPRQVLATDGDDCDCPMDDSDEKIKDIEGMLERYRPYRRAASVLGDLQCRWSSRCFRSPHPLPPNYDLGDLYTLSSLWWELMGKHRDRREESEDDVNDDVTLLGMPSPIPDEIHVERRMEAIMDLLQSKGSCLSSILGETRKLADLVVTVLALLELSRRNRVRLDQKEIFGDVFIFPHA